VTPNEIQALIVGLGMGGLIANGTHAWLAGRDVSRAATEAETAHKRAAGDRYLVSMRLYRIQRKHGLVP